MVAITQATVDAHASSDGNTQTEVSGATIRTKLVSDLFGSAVSSKWTAATPANWTATEAGGKYTMTMASSAGGVPELYWMVSVASGTALNFEYLYANFNPTPDAGDDEKA